MRKPKQKDLMKFKEINVASDGNCGYRAYAVGLIHFLRRLNDLSLQAIVLRRLQLTSDESSMLLSASDKEIENFLHLRLRQFAVQHLRAQFAANPEGCDFFLCLQHLVGVRIVKKFQLNEEAKKYFIPNGKLRDFTKPDISELPDLDRKLDAYFEAHATDFAPEDRTGEELVKYLQAFELQLTKNFLMDNNAENLEAYYTMLGGNRFWATTEMLYVLNMFICNERKEKYYSTQYSETRLNLVYDIEITLRIYEAGLLGPQLVGYGENSSDIALPDPDIELLSTWSQIHWKCLISSNAEKQVRNDGASSSSALFSQPAFFHNSNQKKAQTHIFSVEDCVQQYECDKFLTFIKSESGNYPIYKLPDMYALVVVHASTTQDKSHPQIYYDAQTALAESIRILQQAYAQPVTENMAKHYRSYLQGIRNLIDALRKCGQEIPAEIENQLKIPEFMQLVTWFRHLNYIQFDSAAATCLRDISAQFTVGIQDWPRVDAALSNLTTVMENLYKECVALLQGVEQCRDKAGIRVRLDLLRNVQHAINELCDFLNLNPQYSLQELMAYNSSLLIYIDYLNEKIGSVSGSTSTYGSYYRLDQFYQPEITKQKVWTELANHIKDLLSDAKGDFSGDSYEAVGGRKALVLHDYMLQVIIAYQNGENPCLISTDLKYTASAGKQQPVIARRTSSRLLRGCATQHKLEGFTDFLQTMLNGLADERRMYLSPQ